MPSRWGRTAPRDRLAGSGDSCDLSEPLGLRICELLGEGESFGLRAQACPVKTAVGVESTPFVGYVTTRFLLNVVGV